MERVSKNYYYIIRGEKNREDINVYERNVSYVKAQKKINDIIQNAPREFTEKYREINRSMLKAQESKKDCEALADTCEENLAEVEDIMNVKENDDGLVVAENQAV